MALRKLFQIYVVSRTIPFLRLSRVSRSIDFSAFDIKTRVTILERGDRVMKGRILLLLCLSLLTALSAFAQTKTVTNFDLEKFRDQRLLAEKDLRENYLKLGFPSPEELERQREKDRIERETLSARLTKERYERERIEAEQTRANNEINYRRLVETERYSNYSSGYNGIIYSGGYFPRYRNNRYWGVWPRFHKPIEPKYPVFRTPAKPAATWLKQ